MTALGFKFFHSGEVGAPVLTGQAGKLIDVLDWALDVGDATLGWEKVFAGTNKAVYRPRYGLQPYLDVDDSASLVGSGRDAAVRAYEAMTGLGAGTSPFHLPAVVSTTAWRKSNTADAVARRYCGIKTAQMLVLFLAYSNSNSKDGGLLTLSQVPALHPAEAYPVVFSAINLSTNGTLAAQSYGALGNQGTTYSWGGESFSVSTSQSCWMRNPSGAIKAVAGKVRGAHSSLYQITDGTEVALVRAELLSNESNTTTSVGKPRSYLPNVWTTAADLVTAGWQPGDTFTIPDYDPSAVFFYAGDSYCPVILEMSDTGGAV